MKFEIGDLMQLYSKAEVYKKRCEQLTVYEIIQILIQKENQRLYIIANSLSGEVGGLSRKEDTSFLDEIAKFQSDLFGSKDTHKQ